MPFMAFGRYSRSEAAKDVPARLDRLIHAAILSASRKQPA